MNINKQTPKLSSSLALCQTQLSNDRFIGKVLKDNITLRVGYNYIAETADGSFHLFEHNIYGIDVGTAKRHYDLSSIRAFSEQR